MCGKNGKSGACVTADKGTNEASVGFGNIVLQYSVTVGFELVPIEVRVPFGKVPPLSVPPSAILTAMLTKAASLKS